MHSPNVFVYIHAHVLQYSVVIFFIIWLVFGLSSGVGFLIGAIFSGAAGYVGMNISVRSNVRTTQAASSSLAEGL